MQTLENLERKFLSAVEIKPFELGDIHASINSDKKLSPEQSRHDIASAFITDKDVQISTFGFNGDIGYTFTKYGLADYPYC